jgi:quercetin dioxygenase-like cupin family protein
VVTLACVTRAGTEQSFGWLGGSVHRVALDGAATGGRLTVLRSTMRGGTASPVHVHEHDDETVFVLAGRGVVWAGDQRWELGPGDTAFLPRGLPHTYRFTSAETELLTVCNPAGMEDFFRAAGWDLATEPPPGWQVDMAELAAAGVATGQRVLGPPLDVDDVMPAEYLRAG